MPWPGERQPWLAGSTPSCGSERLVLPGARLGQVEQAACGWLCRLLLALQAARCKAGEQPPPPATPCRQGLRLHDNPALLAALEGGAEHLYPVFVLDPHFLKPDRRVDARLLALEGPAAQQGAVLQHGRAQCNVRRQGPQA